ncbi:restriction endonuclease subunit M, partial [Candidatus Parcubacteria bacterium]|nr:restriction endonuclease subunit M [Candidatus Parcubacteria bacterium]
MSNKIFLQKLGFIPKENTEGVFYKSYKTAGDYCVEVDIEKKQFIFGTKIKSENKTTQNFFQEENWVIFECVNRLLEKGYKPEDIILEKTWGTGHGTSGRLDILVKKNKQAYLMIECKTYGNEFEKEFKKMQKDGGQLFTYFQQDTKAEYLMLYTSEFDGKEINYKNEIVKTEEHYRDAGNVEDFYNRWNKITNQNGIFESWVKAYHFENKALTKKDLKTLAEEDSESIFNSFESILRAHSVSDAPNAFNKIFNLFLAKIFDEKKKESDELDFQWKERRDDHVDFQVRLINLYKEGMKAFLEKEVEGIKDSDFSYETQEELKEKKKKILMFNNVFAIKEVFDKETFEDNAKVLKEVVQLLSKYKIRYPRRQQHLSNFFERLLTTGLKQRAGQFFTPPPVARFVIKSLPFQKVIQKTFAENEIPKLPAVIDYAAGSGHFLTEVMEEIQNIINATNADNFYPDVANQIKVWKIREYDWAAKYIYGIEKDYRLVKVAKVGCYFYGDGLAQVIYGDGLDNFSKSKSYRGLLHKNAEKPQFDFLISNPPYSVDNFKRDIKNKNPKESFTLYNGFVART